MALNFQDNKKKRENIHLETNDRWICNAMRDDWAFQSTVVIIPSNLEKNREKGEKKVTFCMNN